MKISPCFFWMSFLLVIAGCQHRDEIIAGIGIPIPQEMRKIPDKGFDPIPGFEIGQASFRGRVAPREIFTFYQEVMEARGWRPDAYFAGAKDKFAYAKANKVVLISYYENGDGTTDLIIMVGPGKPNKF